MIQDIDTELYRIEVPLPNNPLKTLNAYLIRDKRRSLLIDTGFNRPECRDALLDGLKKLNVRLSNLDYFITHRHADHSGLAAELAGESAKSGPVKVMSTKEEADGVNNSTLGMVFWEKLIHNMIPHGVPRPLAERMFSEHPAARYKPESDFAFTHVEDGDVLQYGGYVLTVVRAPGHTPGQVTLYDSQRKYYFSGDHILGKITPNIASWHDGNDSLGLYLKTLDKILTYDIKLTLPGHRALVEKTASRINELKEHHAVRLNEILEILGDGPATAYQLAGRMQWSIRAKSWKEFPDPQKWFASGEALAHLEHLTAIKKVKPVLQNNFILFTIN